MRKLLKCKLAAFWYCCGVRHRTPEPAPSPSLPLPPCRLRAGRGMELGKMDGQSYHRAAGQAPTSRGPPKRASDCTATGGIAMHREQAAPHTLDPRRSWDFRKAPAAEGSPMGAAQGQVFFGTTARSGNFLQVVET